MVIDSQLQSEVCKIWRVQEVGCWIIVIKIHFLISWCKERFNAGSSISIIFVYSLHRFNSDSLLLFEHLPTPKSSSSCWGALIHQRIFFLSACHMAGLCCWSVVRLCGRVLRQPRAQCLLSGQSKWLTGHGLTWAPEGLNTGLTMSSSASRWKVTFHF